MFWTPTSNAPVEKGVKLVLFGFHTVVWAGDWTANGGHCLTSTAHTDLQRARTSWWAAAEMIVGINAACTAYLQVYFKRVSFFGLGLGSPYCAQKRIASFPPRFYRLISCEGRLLSLSRSFFPLSMRSQVATSLSLCTFAANLHTSELLTSGLPRANCPKEKKEIKKANTTTTSNDNNNNNWFPTIQKEPESLPVGM